MKFEKPKFSFMCAIIVLLISAIIVSYIIEDNTVTFTDSKVTPSFGYEDVASNTMKTEAIADYQYAMDDYIRELGVASFEYGYKCARSSYSEKQCLDKLNSILYGE